MMMMMMDGIPCPPHPSTHTHTLSLSLARARTHNLSPSKVEASNPVRAEVPASVVCHHDRTAARWTNGSPWIATGPAQIGKNLAKGKGPGR